MDPNGYFAIGHIDISPRVPNGIENCELLLHKLAARDNATPGLLDVLALKQTVYLSHFEVIRRYRSEEAYFEHLAEPSYRALRAGIASALGSPYEDRLLRARDERPWPRAGVRDFIAITQLDIQPQRLETSRHVLDEFADAQRSAPGLIGQVFLQRTVRDNNLELVSVWSSAEAFEDHLAAKLVRQAREAVAPLLVAPIEDRRHQVLCGGWSTS